LRIVEFGLRIERKEKFFFSQSPIRNPQFFVWVGFVVYSTIRNLQSAISLMGPGPAQPEAVNPARPGREQR